MAGRKLGIVAVLILSLVAACDQAVPSGSSVVQSAAPPASPASSAGTGTASRSAGPTAGSVGSYSVTLTGPRTGAGSYSGTAQVTCTAPTSAGGRYWTATAIILSGVGGSLTDFSLSQDSEGRETVSATAGGMETGSWYFNSTSPNTTASVAGSGQPGVNGLVTGDATYTDSEGRLFTAHISAECSETYY